MNTALRIASVTFVLRDILNKGLNDYNASDATGVGTTVTATSPDRIDTSQNGEPSQLNLFMYQATPNQGWRNVGFPAFNGNGDRVNNPPLAIDLHYLLSAYGSQELHTDILLGYGMQILHENPVLDRNLINTFVSDPGLSAQLKTLADAQLADQVEMVTITPEILSIEDISKLWAAFATKYRPTAAYKATVILIETSKSTKTGPPVQTRKIYAVPIKKPVIESILSQSAAGQPIVDNQIILNSYFIILKGTDFYTETTQVTVDGESIPATSSLTISDTQISFQLTNDLNLKAGTHTLAVVQPMIMGNDTTPQHKGVSSEPATFVLAPQIQNINPLTVTMPANGSVSITIKVNPNLYPGQKVTLLLNALAADANGNFPAYSFQTSLPTLIDNPGALPTDSVSIPITKVVTGQFAASIEVDGIESPVDFPLGSNAAQVLTIQ
jgi:hypothetical protein